MKRIVIVGATSGIGFATARACIREGWRLGAAGRRLEALEALRAEAPEQVEIEPLDVTRDDAPEHLDRLIQRLGGMDTYLHVSGIGSRNFELRPDIEVETLRTNGEGFVRMVTAAYACFRKQGGGHLAVISSIAGTRGLGAAPAYSATKRMQNTYIDALAQLARMEGHDRIRFTDIRPGFIATPLLAREPRYPMLMQTEKVVRRIMQVLRNPRRRVVIDRRYALLVLLWRLIPQGIWERLKIRPREK
uniref:SDR family NAD(P)-dependent oxidoreductase n=1 Tax=Alistipes megaguti TaxID=2364787 RepID=UPI000EFD5360|nr:SDR family NAD(P)-dependent oxidoreductase [Alistipes megaguti]